MEGFDIQEVIRRGEDSYTQFKENIFNATKLAEEMVAFSNASGGTIIIGVSDQGEIVGLDDRNVHRLNQLVANTANENIKPPIYPVVTIESIENRNVMLVNVRKGTSKPYATSSGLYLVKSGADKRKVGPEELRRLFAESAFSYADEAINAKSSLADLDEGEFSRFFFKKKNRPFRETGLKLETVLENLNLYASGCLTLAGTLFFAGLPQKDYPMFMIQAVHLAGTNMLDGHFLNKKYFSGNLRMLFEQAMMFFTAALVNIQDKPTFNTPGLLEIPEVALQEAIVNALIHRDYFISAPIKLYIFADRVEIVNPGKLVNMLTVEKIKSGLSIARNPILHSIAPFVLDYSGFGNGIEKIISLCPTVEFINDTVKEEFRCIFMRPKLETRQSGTIRVNP